MLCNDFGLGSCAVEGFYVGPLRQVWFLQYGSEGRLRLVSKNKSILNGAELFFLVSSTNCTPLKDPKGSSVQNGSEIC